MQLGEVIAEVHSLGVVDEKRRPVDLAVISIAARDHGVECVVSSTLEDEDHLLEPGACAGRPGQKFPGQKLWSHEGRKDQSQCGQPTFSEQVSAIHHGLLLFPTETASAAS